MSTASDRLARNLYAAGVLFAAGSAVHIIDHLRRGQGSVSEGLYWAGNVALILQVTIVVLILTRHRLSPIVSMAGGFALALGFMAAHWLPEWSGLSDPVWEISSWTALSYVASSLEILGAVAVGVCGLAIVRRDGIESFASPSATGARSV
jgi:hypothetical protein